MGPPETENPPAVAAAEGPNLSTEKRLNGKNTTRGADDYARERYTMDTQIKRILRAHARKVAPGRYPGDVYRVVDCTWARVGDVTMVKPADRDTYHYKGLATCGSVHACPICASALSTAG